jgi:hypothetical protein
MQLRGADGETFALPGRAVIAIGRPLTRPTSDDAEQAAPLSVGSLRRGRWLTRCSRHDGETGA